MKKFFCLFIIFSLSINEIMANNLMVLKLTYGEVEMNFTLIKLLIM